MGAGYGGPIDRNCDRGHPRRLSYECWVELLPRWRLLRRIRERRTQRKFSPARRDRSEVAVQLNTDLKLDLSVKAPGSLQLAIEPQIFAAEHLRDVCNLPVVQAEVLDNLIHGMEAAHGVSLNLVSLKQL